MSQVDGQELLAALRSRLAEEGLGIVLPLPGATFNEVAAGTGSPGLTELLPEARAAIVVGDGGPSFFERFETDRRAAPLGIARGGPGPSWSSDPLDAYTVAVLERGVAAAWTVWSSTVTWRVFHPFIDATPALPFQRLGAAAGVPAPGPLGIQVHPHFGPWWAYRALLVVSFPLRTEASLAASCPGCSRPCVAACPAGAVSASGFFQEPCTARRRLGPPCDEHCVARVSCPVGPSARYSDRQLAFHMRASLRLAAR